MIRPRKYLCSVDLKWINDWYLIMKKYDVYGGLLWLIISIFVGVMGINFGIGTIRYPGPGFLPLLMGIILFGLALGMIILATRKKNQEANFKESPSYDKSVFWTLAILFVYAFLLEFLGYIIASFLVILYLFKVPGGRKWGFSIFVTLVTIAVTWYFFGILLQAQFPKGLWDIG